MDFAHTFNRVVLAGTLRRPRQHRWRWLLGLGLVLLVGCARALAEPASPSVKQPIPVFAYYYIWFDHKSWDRAKSDFSVLGGYSSDDQSIMKEHIRLAKQAGIDGFIVSWKSTSTLDRRLERLVEIADAENFKLAIIYQGLDFERHPLPAEKVAADLDYFTTHFASHKAFDAFARPLVIWSGTWEFSPEVIANVTRPRREHLLILASEKNVEGFQHIADDVDGNAYYWSSVNPETFPKYQEKLNTMGKVIHDHGGMWIAPAAVGFDAQLIGGTRIVDRKDGQTLRLQMNAAIQSAPDAVGVISWNEFSENSHIEPSINYGDQALKVIADIQGAGVALGGDFDSSTPGETQVRPFTLIVLGGMIALIAGCIIMLLRRGRNR